MVHKNNSKNNFAFIDAQNLFVSLSRKNISLDYKKFRIYLADKYKVKKVFYFIGYRDKYRHIYKNLENFGFTLIFKKTTERGAETKGNCDSNLIVQIIREWKNFDKAVLISGDGDFLPIVEYLEEHNKLLKIGIPTLKSRSKLLKCFQHQTFFIDRITKITTKNKNG